MCGDGDGDGDGDDEGMAGDTGIGDDETADEGWGGDDPTGDPFGGFAIADTDPGTMGEAPSGADIGEGFATQGMLADYYMTEKGQHNVAMNTAFLDAVFPGLGVFEQGIFGQAHEAIAMGEDLGSPTGYGEGGAGDDAAAALFNPFSSVVSPPAQPQPISPLSAEEEERRKIARRTGRKSTRLEELPWPPAVGRATLLGG